MVASIVVIIHPQKGSKFCLGSLSGCLTNIVRSFHSKGPPPSPLSVMQSSRRNDLSFTGTMFFCSCRLEAVEPTLNKKVHGQCTKDALQLVTWARSYVEDYYHANGSTERPLPQTSVNPTRWTHPAAGHYKLNVDAALDCTKGLVGIGAIIRNHQGEVLGALANKLDGTMSVVEAEAVALLRILKWAKDVGVPIDAIEIDALSMLTLYSDRECCLSQLKGLLLDINILLSSFLGVSLVHVRREANNAAHGLARFSLRINEELVWLDSIPPPIVSVVLME
ncbi:Ribonuclease H-like domain containing protein [Trema orientale]|uniref:Ribonuclease H-like domain containing protein n=1 Tax=Trema orientale TaxID=63057 RepID=A0A2P5D7R4_TREOI|nr:Ribonuclease H-like domain containing protein [Trema orientale]